MRTEQFIHCPACFLDLKVPRLTGFDVLEWLACRPELDYLPVAILSSSSHEADQEKARRLDARDYLIKPHSFRILIRMLQDVTQQWLVKAPKAA